MGKEIYRASLEMKREYSARTNTGSEQAYGWVHVTMYLTASLDQPLHYAGEGLTNKLGAWAWGMVHGGKKRSLGSCVPLFVQAAHRRTISHELCTVVLPPRLLREYMHTTQTSTLYSSVSCLARGVFSTHSSREFPVMGQKASESAPVALDMAGAVSPPAGM